MTHPLDTSIADIESRIQDLYREKERLEMTRDAEAAPALIKTLLDLGCQFALDHCHHTRANILIPDDVEDDKVLRIIRAYIGGGLTDDCKALAADVSIWSYREETPYIYVSHPIGAHTDEEVVTCTLRALKALGIPGDRLSLSDYEREVANHERNRARVQSDLDKVRALVEAY